MSSSFSSASASAAASTSTTSPTSSSFLSNLSNLGLGYTVAIALGSLVLLSSLLFASYLCLRRRSLNPNPNPNPNPTPTPNPNHTNGVVLPRIIFVAEDEEEEDDYEGTRGSAVTGLDPAAIGSYPRFAYSTGKGGGDATCCAICLCEYKEGEMLRMIPDCRHYFHVPCIDEWLRLNASCPVCRTSPMPTPLSTPLSEVVPLSQFAADRRRR